MRLKKWSRSYRRRRIAGPATIAGSKSVLSRMASPVKTALQCCSCRSSRWLKPVRAALFSNLASEGDSGGPRLALETKRNKIAGLKKMPRP
jgi:hypothetical protein